MQVGCGFRTKPLRGHDYVYFWHYENRGGRSRQVYEYMGPCRSLDTARRVGAPRDAHFSGGRKDPPPPPVRHRAANAGPLTPLRPGGPPSRQFWGAGWVGALNKEW